MEGPLFRVTAADTSINGQQDWFEDNSDSSRDSCRLIISIAGK
jgi:hypothetical protein